MRIAIITTIWFALILGSGDSKGPWYAAIASIFMGVVLDRLAALRPLGVAEGNAQGVLGVAFLAGILAHHARDLPGPEWVHNVAAGAAVFVCAAIVSVYLREVRKIDRDATEDQK